MSEHMGTGDIETGVFGRLGQVWQRVAYWLEVRTSRRELAELDDAALHDLGISRAQARFEADRAPWDDAPVPGIRGYAGISLKQPARSL